MKIFAKEFLAHRKIIFIFILAIFLPSLIVGYLSLSTFTQRREAVKNFLQSNLWISGEAALKSIESTLLEQEKNALKSENFIHLIQLNKDGQSLCGSSEVLSDIAGELFLLDADYQLIFPETGSEYASVFQWERDISNSEFARFFQEAEFAEFSQKDFTRAADLYTESTLVAPSKQHHAAALDGLGRCLLSSDKYDEAYEVYVELSENFGQFQSKAGHPYGITAVFQLFEIDRRRNKEADSVTNLLDLYKRMRNGVWLLNASVYNFFIEEIETILNIPFNEGKFPEIQKSYQDLQKQQSPYRQTLLFTGFLEREVILKLVEKLSLSRMTGEVVPGRLLTTSENDYHLISYAGLTDIQSGQTFYGGFYWDLNSLKKQILPKVLEDLTKDSGLIFQIVNEDGQNISTGIEEPTSEDFLILSSHIFPLPWKLLVSHPDIIALERTALKENFFYGVLLAFIVALMLFGAVLMMRDISRETETTRLKTEFVHNISHELKTPLTLIRLWGETLQTKKNLTQEQKKESYEIITKESERLSHMINNVLDFSRIEMGRKEFNFKKGNLSEVVLNTVESYRYHFEKKGFTFQTDIVSDLPEMNFDGEAVASVLVNLLSNAVKFSPKKREVTVKLFRDDGNAVLQVADKGIGISQNEVSKIFKRFYRSKNNVVSESGGSGLGLTLVKHIVDAHGGRVEVESQPGKGSIFSVILPISTRG